MVKRIFSVIFTIFLAFSVFIGALSVDAYEVTGFEITANAGMLISMDTGEILYENNADKKIYPASITKIMTAILMIENEKFDPDAKIAMTEEVLTMILGTGSVVSNLRAGEEITQRDLLYYVLMSSAGDCTYLAAIHYSGSVKAFVADMNAKAKELGLKNTHYVNPIGLHDDEHYTTVKDIYTLAKYALQNPTFKEVCETPRYTVPATNYSGARTLSSTNFLMDNTTNYYYQYAKGVKTGFTDEAGRCLVSTASYDGYKYMCIVMGCPGNLKNHFTESTELYRWAFNNFSFKEVAKSEEPVCEMPVELSMDTDFVPLYFKEPFVSILPNDADDSTIVIKPHLNAESIKAPVKKGTVLGTADVIFAEKVIGNVELVAGIDVESSKILEIVETAKKVVTSKYMKFVYVVIIVVICGFILICIIMNVSHRKKRKVKYVPYKGKERKNYRNDD